MAFTLCFKSHPATTTTTATALIKLPFGPITLPQPVTRINDFRLNRKGYGSRAELVMLPGVRMRARPP